ncbi:hypothetical protein F383_25445 [Gossypium arboreum]|uniref:Uncharacterized protein n=1 Tax=Gossypium arboreum TaxID=29729 RepID=A0A0B0MPE4_GOSAR|nr:hypothetical protein F383_25445 [Gossypium arboreum]
MSGIWLWHRYVIPCKTMSGTWHWHRYVVPWNTIYGYGIGTLYCVDDILSNP